MEDLKRIFSSKSWRIVSQRLFPCVCKLCNQTSRELVCNQCQVKLYLPKNVCRRCGESMVARRILTQDSINLCGACIHQPPAYSQTIFAFTYEGKAARLVQQFKFREDLALCHFLAERVSDQVLAQSNNLERPDALIPIPLHLERLKQRGFNQSLELAKYIGKQLDIAVYKDSLIRKRATPQQSGLSRKARQRNIQGAFQLGQSGAVNIAALKDKHIAIVDDVITTGATVREAAKVLNRSGPSKISVFAIAKTQQDNVSPVDKK